MVAPQSFAQWFVNARDEMKTRTKEPALSERHTVNMSDVSFPDGLLPESDPVANVTPPICRGRWGGGAGALMKALAALLFLLVACSAPAVVNHTPITSKHYENIFIYTFLS
jgi:hypothetical protein